MNRKMNRKTFLHMVKRSPTREMKDDSYYLSDKELREVLRLDPPEQKAIENSRQLAGVMKDS